MDKSEKLQAVRPARVAALQKAIAKFPTNTTSPKLSDHDRGRNSGMIFVAQKLSATLHSDTISDREKIRHATKVATGISSDYRKYSITKDEFRIGRAKGMVEAAHIIRKVLHNPVTKRKSKTGS